jgi:hypothetical protein
MPGILRSNAFREDRRELRLQIAFAEIKTMCRFACRAGAHNHTADSPVFDPFLRMFDELAADSIAANLAGNDQAANLPARLNL